MKRKLLLLTSFILFTLPIALSAQMTYIPDDKFEQTLIDLGYDTPPLNDSIQTKNIDTLTYLAINGLMIKDLTGIEDFKSLNRLSCSVNSLTSLNLNNNKLLEELDCSWNNIKNLEITGCKSLKSVSCYSNPYLTNIDFSELDSIEIIKCQETPIRSIDINNCSKLKELNCSQTLIKDLDVDNNRQLEILECYVTQLESLDLKNNIYLKSLSCSQSQINYLNLEKNENLESLDCRDSKVIDLDVRGCISLKKLICYGNQIISLDLSFNLKLSMISCFDNKLIELNLRNSKNGIITHFDVKNNPNLSCIQVDDSSWSANNKLWLKDTTAHYSENCGYTGIENEIVDNNFSISPNPASDYIEISVGAQRAVPDDMAIFNFLGECAIKVEQTSPSVQRIDISHISPGIYFVRVGDVVRKFVKY